MDEFSIFDDSQSLGSGFIIHPGGASVSVITDDFTHSSAEDTDTESSTPLAQLIGRSVLSVFNTNKAALAHSKKGRINGDSSFYDNHPSLGEDEFDINPDSQPRGIRRNSFTKSSNHRLNVSSNHNSGSQMNGSISGGFFDVVVLDEPDPRHRSRALQLDMESASGGDDAGGTGTHHQKGPIDFLKDPKHQMTYGRRIALALQSKRWYNPSYFDGEKVTPSEVSENGDEAEEQNHKEGFDVNPNWSYRNSARGRPSLAVAWAYFEHFILPRHVILDDQQKAPESDYRDRQKERQRRGKYQHLEIAEAGEQHLQTQLYHPFKTPLREMANFGLGHGLYFVTLRAVAIVTFIAGLISIPNIWYFSGKEYSANQIDVPLALKGSAICTESKYVPCLNCSNYERELKWENLTSIDGTNTQTFALKNECGGVTFTAGMVNFGAILFIILGLFFVSYYVAKEEVKFDENELTAQDYSIMIKNPPGDARDPQEWRNFFDKKFAAHTTSITIALDNEKITNMLIKRRVLLLKLKGKVDPSESLEMDNLERLASEMEETRSGLQAMVAKLPLLGGIPELYRNILVIEEKICDMLAEEGEEGPPVTKVFVTFETETSQRRVLTALATPYPDERYIFREEKFLKVEEAGEPSSIRWHNLNENIWQTLWSVILPNVLTLGLIIGAALLVRTVHDRSTFYSAITITVLNMAFPFIAKGLTYGEVHNYEGERQTSLYLKISIFRWVNTAVVMTLITPFTSTVKLADDSVLSGVYAIFFSEIVVANLVQLLDFGGFFKRHILAPRAKTQETMNAKMMGTTVDIAERYTAMSKTLFLGLWYCSIYPSILFMCSFALMVNYFIDGFSLMRTWTPLPKMDSAISKINRKITFPISILVMVVISSYTWTQFSFDNLCLTDPDESYFGTWDITSFSGGENDTIPVTFDGDSEMYTHCNQNLLDIDRMTFPALPSFQQSGLEWMSDEQARLTYTFGWASLAIIVLIIMSVLFMLVSDLTRGYKPRGDVNEDNMPFSATRTPVYILQIRSRVIPYPLIACSTEGISEDRYGWHSLYNSHEYYDLTIDARRIIERGERSASLLDNAFGSVTFSPPPV